MVEADEEEEEARPCVPGPTPITAPPVSPSFPQALIPILFHVFRLIILRVSRLNERSNRRGLRPRRPHHNNRHPSRHHCQAPPDYQASPN